MSLFIRGGGITSQDGITSTPRSVLTLLEHNTEPHCSTRILLYFIHLLKMYTNQGVQMLLVVFQEKFKDLEVIFSVTTLTLSPDMFTITVPVSISQTRRGVQAFPPPNPPRSLPLQEAHSLLDLNFTKGWRSFSRAI